MDLTETEMELDSEGDSAEEGDDGDHVKPTLAIIVRSGGTARHIIVRAGEPLRTGLWRWAIELGNSESLKIGGVTIDAGESPEMLGYPRGHAVPISLEQYYAMGDRC